MSDSPDEERIQLNRGSLNRRDSAHRISIAAQWSGPLPPPSALQAYEQAFPGCAERIVAMAEPEAEHSRSIEREQVNTDKVLIQADTASERLGMWLAFVLSVFVIAISTYLIRIGLLGWGVGLVSLQLISLVSLFIYGRNHPRS